MEYVGIPGPDGYDRVVVRGRPRRRGCSPRWWLRGGRVVAGMHANDWDAIAEVRRIVGAEVDGDRLADEKCRLGDYESERPWSRCGLVSVHGRTDRVPAAGAAGGHRAEPLWREAVGQELREERHRQERTLADVAEESGVSTQYLSEIERGRKEPSPRSSAPCPARWACASST